MSLIVGAVTDKLYGFAQIAVAGVTVDGDPAVAVDGNPDTLTFGMFVVGVQDPQGVADTTVTRAWSDHGDGFIDDDFTIPAYIDVRMPGIVQKAPRDVAEAMFNTFWPLIAADTSLGGLLVGGGYAEVSTLVSTPENVGTPAEPGRRHLIRFGVHCLNLTR